MKDIGGLTVEDLPDYPSLARLASALWNDSRARGAAVFVGAGFSRNAELAGQDTKLPPLWSDLRRAMAEKLYHGRIDDAPADPLRLAEEFRIFLGQAALTEFLRDQVPDASWRHGKLHTALMSLPWAEVLTTNYDTLLERASDRHGVVQDAADLARVRGPRVIKLHGSIGGGGRLVIAEEDYRTYPTQSAAFVNTARQVFLENELCLIGFSGDDPNFLQWSGWVRDHLGANARRIYLVGSLDLNPAKRRLLESRNVAPIDLAPLTKDMPREQAENAACEIFLSFLTASKPRTAFDWQPSNAYDFISADPKIIRDLLNDPGASASMLEKVSSIWQTDQESCPEWLVLPKEKRQGVKFANARAPIGFLRAVSLLEENKQALLLSQLVWRKKVILDALGDEVYSAIVKILKSGSKILQSQRITLSQALLFEARMRRDEVEFHRATTFLSAASSPGSDEQAEVVAQKLMWARDGLDYESLSNGLKDLEGPNPGWRVLRASLHCDCGETAIAKSLIAEARTDLAKRRREDPRSTSVMSRGAWTDFFGASFTYLDLYTPEIVSSRQIVAGYDVAEEISAISREQRASRLREIKQPQGYQPTFGPGGYQDHSRTIRFRSATLGHEAEAVFRLADASCLPLRVENVDLLASLAQEALEGEPLPTLVWHLRLLRTLSYLSPTLERYFNGVAIACLDQSLANELTERVLAAARFWLKRLRNNEKSDYTSSIERLRVYLEILARLIVRANSAVSLDAFDFGCKLMSDSSTIHHWLFEPLDNLLKWSLVSLPPEVRDTLVLRCLELPLSPLERPAPFRWPEPVSNIFNNATKIDRPLGDARWAACVARLLSEAEKSGPARQQAILRLAYLADYGCLDASELKQFGRVLWSRRDVATGELPLDSDLFPHVLATLPGNEMVIPKEVVQSYLFNSPHTLLADEKRLVAIAAAARGGGKTAKMLPTNKQAVAILDAFVISPKLREEPTDPIGSQLLRSLRSAVGSVLGNAVLPSLLLPDITPERLNFIEGCARLGNGGGALAGLHELARLVPEMTQNVCDLLRRALVRGDLNDVAGASASIVKWALVSGRDGYAQLPGSIKDAVLASLESGVRPALQSRLWCSRQLLQSKSLSEAQSSKLSSLLRELWEELAYDTIPQEGPAAINITSARGECVRLASSLIAAGHVAHGQIIDVSNDPLPEVRFATSIPD